MSKPSAAVISALIVGLMAGCASENGAEDDDDLLEDPNVPGAAPGLGRDPIVSVDYQPTAEGNWKKGVEAFEDEDYAAAQRYFEYILNKFSYKPIAALARVRVGDCLFERDRFEEAIFTYETFMKRQPTHPQVSYAMYKIAMAYVEQLPGDWFLMPPSHEKDQAKVRLAATALQQFLRRFPKDENAEEVKEKLAEVRGRLMAHERYVADFYRKLDRDRAYVGRLEVIRRDFVDVGLTDELLAEIIEVWARLNEVDKAQSALDQLEKAFPDSEALSDARQQVTEARERVEAAEAKAEADDADEASDDAEAGDDEANDSQVEKASGSTPE